MHPELRLPGLKLCMAAGRHSSTALPPSHHNKHPSSCCAPRRLRAVVADTVGVSASSLRENMQRVVVTWNLALSGLSAGTDELQLWPVPAPPGSAPLMTRPLVAVNGTTT